MSRYLPALRLVCRVIVGGLFLYAGIVKALDPRAFAGEIAAYRLFPYGLNLLIAATLPWIEIVSGGLVLGGRKLLPAAAVLLALETVFALVLISGIVRGLTIDCGCFGSGAGISLPMALLRDLLLFALTVLLCLLHRPLHRADD